MNSKLIKASLAGVAAIAVTAGGTTFAAWSDFSNVNDNGVGAGVLKMTLTPNSANPGEDITFDNIKLAPGQYYERQAYIATNSSDSTPNAKLFLDIPRLVGTENGCDTNSETSEDSDCGGTNAGDLINQATLDINSSLPGADGTCSVANATSGKQVLPTRGFKLSDLIAGTFPQGHLATPPQTLELTGEYKNTTSPFVIVPGLHPDVVNKKNLAPGEGMCVLMTVGLPNLPNNNLAQGDDVSFDLRFEVRQDTFSYGSDSDYFQP